MNRVQVKYINDEIKSKQERKLAQEEVTFSDEEEDNIDNEEYTNLFDNVNIEDLTDQLTKK